MKRRGVENGDEEDRSSGMERVIKRARKVGDGSSRPTDKRERRTLSVSGEAAAKEASKLQDERANVSSAEGKHQNLEKLEAKREAGYSDDSEDEKKINVRRRILSSRTCPYLDQIDRKRLDFDFEKVCSVSLSNLNVYACLACGKFFQGRGLATHAYNHAIHEGHNVFVSLDTKRVYCLPDNYEVIDSSLDDIKYLMDPRFTPAQVAALDKKVTTFRALDGLDYVPGVIGVNNLKNNSYMGCIVHALVHVRPIRDFFLMEENYAKKCRSPLVSAFGEFVRKVWNPRNFRGQVSPHELMQAISVASERRFEAGGAVAGDPLAFLPWFLNTLHTDLGGSRGPKRGSIVRSAFQGRLQVITEKTEREAEDRHSTAKLTVTGSKISTVPFLLLTIQPPGMPIFKDKLERNIIPQVPLYSVLEKYNGKMPTAAGDDQQRRMSLQVLPPYLIIVVRRFIQNNFFNEKNRTIVVFPVKNLEMKDFITPEQLPRLIATKYDLLANIRHDGKTLEDDEYSLNVCNKASGIWYHIRDIDVQETAPQLMSVTEALVQIYELKAPGTNASSAFATDSGKTCNVGGDTQASTTVKTEE